MVPAPVDFTAGFTLLEMADELAGARFEQVQDGGFLHIAQQAVAGHAAGEGKEAVDQIETLDDLAQLLERVAGTQAVTAQDALALEQAAVAGEEDAVFADRLAGEDIIGDIVVIGSVKAEHAQVARQAAEVAVEDEAQVAQGPGTEVDGIADVDGLEDGVDGNAVAILGDAVKIDGLTIDEDQVDLGMGDAERFGQMLDGLAALEGERDIGEVLARGQEVVQLGVEAERGAFAPVIDHTGYPQNKDSTAKGEANRHEISRICKIIAFFA